MSDDETKKDETTEETPVQDEDTQSTGPVEGSDSSSSQAAGEEPDPTPPVEEAPTADAEEPAAADEGSSDDAPAAEEEAAPADDEGSSDEAPADEQAEPPADEQAEAPAGEEAPAEPDPDADLPWKERRRLRRSRHPGEAKPAQTPDERAAARREERKAKAAERRKERAAAKDKRDGAGSGTPVPERESNAAKVRQGIVVSNKGDKSITVRIDIARRHPTYEKIVRRSRTLHAHDERNEAGEGDVVQVIETRPLSKTKRWRLVEVLEKAK
jgi:small subunit ribosomal protein S17